METWILQDAIQTRVHVYMCICEHVCLHVHAYVYVQMCNILNLCPPHFHETWIINSLNTGTMLHSSFYPIQSLYKYLVYSR